MKFVLAIAGSIAAILLLPVIMFGLAWFGGWILSVFVGNHVANGLNLIFNTDRFTPDIIPLTCATIAMIGSFFGASLTVNNKD